MLFCVSTAYEYRIGRVRWNESKSVSFDSRNLRNDFPWKRHVWEMASSSRYCGATRLKKKPEIFRCTASWRIALSAMLFSHGVEVHGPIRQPDRRLRRREAARGR